MKLKNYKVTLVITAEDDDGKPIILKHETMENLQSVACSESIDYDKEESDDGVLQVVDHVPIAYRLNLSIIKELSR